jgi:hypothetical protein
MNTKVKKSEALNLAIKESVREAIVENKNIQKIVLESRLTLINEMIELNEFDFLKRAGQWLKNKAWGAEQGAKDWARKNILVDPVSMIDDPKQVASLLDRTIAQANKEVVSFKSDTLKTSESINKLQNSIFDLLGKFVNLLDKMPPESKGKYEREVMRVVATFYNVLMEEKKRIEVYLSALAREAGNQGYNLGKSATAMAAYRPERAPRVVGSRVVDSEDTEPVLAGARA